MDARVSCALKGGLAMGSIGPFFKTPPLPLVRSSLGCFSRTGWWFDTFVIFHNIWNTLPIDELIFFKIVKTTHQIRLKFYLQHIPFLDAEECMKTHEVVIAVSKAGL